MIGSLGELSPFLIFRANTHFQEICASGLHVLLVYMYTSSDKVFGCLLVEKIFFDQS